jgi:hypothetical protein
MEAFKCQVKDEDIYLSQHQVQYHQGLTQILQLNPYNEPLPIVSDNGFSIHFNEFNNQTNPATLNGGVGGSGCNL